MADETPPKKNRRSWWVLLVCLSAVAGFYFWRHYEIRLDDAKGFMLEKRGKIADNSEPNPVNTEQTGLPTGLPKPSPPLPSATSNDTSNNEVLPLKTFRVGTWDLTPLDFNKMADEARAQRIADIVSEFDLIAIQGVVQTTLPLDELIRRINARGKNFAYIVPNGIGTMPEYVAILLNQSVVKFDANKTYDIADAKLSCRPLVATFRTVEPPPEKAFTFNVINVKIADDRKETETKSLGPLFRMVRARDPAEDDVIMLGNFGLPVVEIDSLRTVPYLTAAQEDVPTSVNGIESSENILFDRMRTVECVGKLQTIDLIKRFNLKLSEVKPLADHLPIGIDFSIFEAGATR
ncbi:MAG: hypothetical protein FWC50_11375 [Planctomycetaceae bacterium]|nr:hypothetical protein [Planctomycetaceae bacterium]